MSLSTHASLCSPSSLDCELPHAPPCGSSSSVRALPRTCARLLPPRQLLPPTCTPLACPAAPLNIIDFVAILPFYIELATSGTGAHSSAAVIRIIRLVRIFRIFKVARYLPWVRIFANALALSVQPLLMLVLIVLITMTVFSSIMYYAERGEWSDVAGAFVRYDRDGNATPSPFQSIPLAMWWAIITMTTGACTPRVHLTAAHSFITVDG